MKYQYVFVVLVTFFGRLTAYPQTIPDKNCQQARTHIMALQFAEASTLLDAEENLFPDNAYVPYLRNYIDFISLFISQQEDLYDSLNDSKHIRFSKVEQLNDTNRYKKFLLGNMHLQWALSKVIFGDIFSGAIEFNTAYHLIENNMQEFPDFIPNLLSMGVLHVIVGLVPDRYNWVLGLLSMEGDVGQGKEELWQFLIRAKTGEEYTYLYPEALFYNGFVEINIHPDRRKVRQIVQEASDMSDTVLLVKFLQLNLLMKSGQNDKALILLQHIDPLKGKAYPFPYLDYLYGECLLRSLQTGSSREHYRIFIRNNKGKNYIKDAWRKIAWTAFLENDTAGYHRFMDHVLSEGASQLGVDKEAYQEALNRKLPDKSLLTARILFDGGYYDDALALMNMVDTAGAPTARKVPYLYRLSRIYHKLGRIDEAKSYYLSTIQMGSDLPAYYAANASLKLGGLYEQEGNYKLAEESYSLCLDLKFDYFRNSIIRRAKEGLKRVR